MQAAAEIHRLLRASASRVFPDADADAIAPAGWALAHGMAYLHIDGTLAAGSPQEVACRVREAFTAIVGASAASSASGSRTSPE